jgi:hypothetical protein
MIEQARIGGKWGGQQDYSGCVAQDVGEEQYIKVSLYTGTTLI